MDDANLQKVKEGEWSEDALRAGLEAGGLDATMYYGCWTIWKDGDAYCGELMQYERVTDSFVGRPLDFTLEKAVKWAKSCQYRL